MNFQRDRKPLLYIDVDGVLVGEYEGFFQLRPHVEEFLSWAIESFECRWLTVRPVFEVTALLRRIDAAYLIPFIEEAIWGHMKIEAIDFTRSFFWIEDGIREIEKAVLRAHGCLDRYIHVDPQGRDELLRVMEMLQEKMK